MANNFLDFYNIIVNELVGDPILFIVLLLLGVTILLVKVRAPTKVYLLTMFAVATMLSVEFQFLRWLILIFGIGFAGWIINGRLRRE